MVCKNNKLKFSGFVTTPNSLYWELTLEYAAVHPHYCTSKTTTVLWMELKLPKMMKDEERMSVW